MHENIKIDRAVKYTEKDGKHIFKNTLVWEIFLVTMCTVFGSMPYKLIIYKLSQIIENYGLFSSSYEILLIIFLNVKNTLYVHR